jgi:hypothetical protein
MSTKNARLFRFSLAATIVFAMSSTYALAHSQESLPVWVEPYTVNGELSWENIAWVETRFVSTDDAKSRWKALTDWATMRKRERAAVMRSRLEKDGVAAAALPEDCYDDDSCQLVGDIEELIARGPGAFPAFTALRAAVQEAAPAVEAFRLAVQTSWHVGLQRKDGTGDRLRVAAICDQAYRIAITGMQYPERQLPRLSESGLKLFYIGLNAEMRKQDRAHTDFVKRNVVADKWPKRSDLGESGSADLWLIIQHSDQDPVFQHRMLVQLTSAVAAGEANAGQVAYLYDRVMLKLSGKQRYGTQLSCDDGHFAPRPLEKDVGATDRLRKDIGMESMTEYLKLFPPECGE